MLIRAARTIRTQNFLLPLFLIVVQSNQKQQQIGEIIVTKLVFLLSQIKMLETNYLKIESQLRCRWNETLECMPARRFYEFQQIYRLQEYAQNFLGK